LTSAPEGDKWSLYPQEESPVPMDRRLGGPQGKLKRNCLLDITLI